MKLGEQHLKDALAYMARGSDYRAMRDKLMGSAVTHGTGACISGFGRPTAQTASAPKVEPLRAGDPPFHGVDLNQRWFEEYVKAVQTPPKPMVVHKPLEDIDNATLVMEMIKRGFAVMKLPADGGPPTALRDG